MKHQALFPYKDKSKKIKCHLLQFLLGAFRVNPKIEYEIYHFSHPLYSVKQNMH